jgi:hypothetical protein
MPCDTAEHPLRHCWTGTIRRGRLIWKPHHLDKTRRFRTLRYIPVYTGTRVFILFRTCIYQYIPNRHVIYLYIRYKRNDGFSIVGALLSGRITQVYTSHVQYNTFWCFVCKTIHVLTSSIETRYTHVHTGIYFMINLHQGIYTVIYLHVRSQKGHDHFSLRIRPYP